MHVCAKIEKGTLIERVMNSNIDSPNLFDKQILDTTLIKNLKGFMQKSIQRVREVMQTKHKQY